MDSTQDHLNSPESGTLHGLRDHSRASARELREFLAGLKGRSPQEAVGIVAQSGLAQGIFWATGGFAVLLIAFTVIPYVMRDDPDAEQPKAAAAAKAPVEAAPAQAAGTPEPESTVSTPLGTVDLNKASAALKIDETKTAAPGANPLEKDLENLLELDD